MRGSVVCETGGSNGCVRILVTDGVAPDSTGGSDSTGRVTVTSPSLTLMGTGRETGGMLAVAEPTMVSYTASNTAKRCLYAHMRNTAP